MRSQRPTGDWEGEMVWCTMILAQWVFVQRIVNRPIGQSTREAIVRHFERSRTAEGGWGLHPESPPYVFTTTLAYTALRLLGLAPTERLLAPALKWLHDQPHGVLAVPTWGKLWLAMLGLYDYVGINPCPPELFLLPDWLPIHPDRYYCHTRAIYLALAYLYGRRFQVDLGSIRTELRHELYDAAYAAIHFKRHRHTVAASDVLVPPNAIVRLVSSMLGIYERRPIAGLRRRALQHCLERVVYEQRSTGYQALSPVNGLLDCLALWAEDTAHPDLAASLDGLDAWRWEDADSGIRYVGARSNTWDTAFAAQSLLDAPLGVQTDSPLRRAFGFLRDAQLTRELPHWPGTHRDAAVGGWCFSDGAHRWPVSDCTAEAVSAILGLQARPDMISADERIPPERLRQAAAFILARQNADGGFATYERRRGPPALELLNPSEMFRNCMVEGSYVECTGSSIAALAHLREAGVMESAAKLNSAIQRGVAFLRRQQKPDGSYLGTWGINITYAIFHVVRGLLAAGVPVRDPTLVRAATWLCNAQRPDGGWGEHYSGCMLDRYVEHQCSQVVMTSWAVLALMDLLGPGAPPVERGITWLHATQSPDGSWPNGAVNGVFFGSAMLDYRLYAAYFPTWALARHARLLSAPRA